MTTRKPLKRIELVGSNADALILGISASWSALRKLGYSRWAIGRAMYRGFREDTIRLARPLEFDDMDDREPRLEVVMPVSQAIATGLEQGTLEQRKRRLLYAVTPEGSELVSSTEIETSSTGLDE